MPAGRHRRRTPHAVPRPATWAVALATLSATAPCAGATPTAAHSGTANHTIPALLAPTTADLALSRRRATDPAPSGADSDLPAHTRAALRGADPVWSADRAATVTPDTNLPLPGPTPGRGLGQDRRHAKTSTRDIPAAALSAYRAAAQDLASSRPDCHLSWTLLAAIGRVESDHASGGALQPDGTARSRILGPVLNGSHGFAAIHDTDHGYWDLNRRWDRAVGPMQFLPGTWRTWGVATRKGAVADPENLPDAAVTAGRYLCANHRDLNTTQGLTAAVLSYDHSRTYLATVRRWATAYRSAYDP